MYSYLLYLNQTSAADNPASTVRRIRILLFWWTHPLHVRILSIYTAYFSPVCQLFVFYYTGCMGALQSKKKSDLAADRFLFFLPSRRRNFFLADSFLFAASSIRPKKPF